MADNAEVGNLVIQRRDAQKRAEDLRKRLAEIGRQLASLGTALAQNPDGVAVSGVSMSGSQAMRATVFDLSGLDLSQIKALLTELHETQHRFATLNEKLRGMGL